jgi:hypothetical protein
LAASAGNADPLGAITLESGASTDVHATTDGAMWLDTGSGPQIIPDRYNGSLSLAQQDRSADINVEVLAGTSPLNLQLLTGAYDGPSYTSIFLLSIPNPDDGPVPNSAWWDMTSGAPDGLWYDTVETGFVVSGSSGGAAYFEMFAWTGLYNTYQAAYNASKAGQPVYVSDSGILPCTTNVGGINPTPILGDYLPAQILKAVPTPEPSMLLLAATGTLGLLAYAWRKRR